MDLPKCRTCGERHRLGPCPSSQPKNTPEASGTARKAPSGLVLAKPSRNSVRASTLAKVDDGVALTSMAHPPGLIDKIAGAIRSGKLKVSPPNPVAKATKGKAGTAEAKGLVRGSTTGTGLRVGEAVAVQPATSEIMDATAGETAPSFDREQYHRDYMRKYMRDRRAAKREAEKAK